jgi:hypothetical protein
VAEDLEQTIRENAAGPKRAQGDAGSVEQHPLEAELRLTPQQLQPIGKEAGTNDGE